MAVFVVGVVGTGAGPVYERDAQGELVLRNDRGQIRSREQGGRRVKVAPADPIRPAVEDWLKANGHPFTIIVGPAPGLPWYEIEVPDEVVASIKGIGNADLLELADSGVLNRLAQERLASRDSPVPLAKQVRETLLAAQRDAGATRELRG